MEQAEKLGCDTPTESMIADAINDAVHDAYNQCQAWLNEASVAGGAPTIERRVKQMHAESWV